MRAAGFSTGQLCAIVGISERRADYWARTGLLRPSLREAHGSGQQHRWSERDVVMAALLKAMLDSGHTGGSKAERRWAFRDVAALVANHGDMSGHVVRTSDGLELVEDDETLLELLNAGAVSFVMSLSRIAQRVSTVATPFSADGVIPPTSVAGKGVGVVESTRAVSANTLKQDVGWVDECATTVAPRPLRQPTEGVGR